MESPMLVLLLVLAGVFVYLIFSPKSIIGPYLDKYCKEKKERWTGETIGESPFKLPFTIHDEITPKKTTKRKTKRKTTKTKTKRSKK